LLCVACAGQMPSPITDSEVPQRKEILRNHRVTVSLLELAPRQATPFLRADCTRNQDHCSSKNSGFLT
jgi:hypothetical protein